MSIIGDLDGLGGHLGIVLGDSARVFRYAPPTDPYKPTDITRVGYPYVTYTNDGFVTEYLAWSARQRGNPPGRPNRYLVEYVDKMVSLSGKTLLATMDAMNAFWDALNAFYDTVTNTCIPGSSYLFGGAGDVIPNPDGQYDLRTGEPVLLSRCTLMGWQVPRAPIR